MPRTQSAAILMASTRRGCSEAAPRHRRLGPDPRTTFSSPAAGRTSPTPTRTQPPRAGRPTGTAARLACSKMIKATTPAPMPSSSTPSRGIGITASARSSPPWCVRACASNGCTSTPKSPGTWGAASHSSRVVYGMWEAPGSTLPRPSFSLRATAPRPDQLSPELTSKSAPVRLRARPRSAARRRPPPPRWAPRPSRARPARSRRAHQHPARVAELGLDRADRLAASRRVGEVDRAAPSRTFTSTCGQRASSAPASADSGTARRRDEVGDEQAR